MSLPMVILGNIFSPLSRLLVKGTNLIENKLESSTNGLSIASKEEFDQAIELTVSQEKDADREIEKMENRSIPEIFEEKDAFQFLLQHGEFEINNLLFKRSPISNSKDGKDGKKVGGATRKRTLL